MRTTLLAIGTLGIVCTSSLPPALAASAKSSATTQRRISASRISRRALQEQARARRLKERTTKSTRPSPQVEPRPGPVTTPATRVEHPTYDALSDTAVRSNLALLGSVSSSIAGVRIFSNQEPIDATAVVVMFDAAMASVSQVLLYDENARYLGAATLDGTDAAHRSYRLPLATSALQLPYRKEISLYARLRLKQHDAGGVSGELVRVDSILVEGDGAWSNSSYTKASSEIFPAFQTARGRIASVTNVGDNQGVLVANAGQQLAQFRFAAERSDAGARVRLTDLRFQIESSGGVTVSNVELRPEGTPDGTPCDVVSGEVVCSSIPDFVGSLGTAPMTLRLYGDVAVSGAGDAFLRFTINDPGTPLDAGAVGWTDGEYDFTWVPFDQPVVRGTSLKR